MTPRLLPSLALCFLLLPCGASAQEHSAWQARVDAELSACQARLDAEKAAYLSRHQTNLAPAELERIFVSVREVDVIALEDSIARLEAMGEEELLMILVESGQPYPRHLATGPISRIGSGPNLGRILRCLDERSQYHLTARSNAEIEAMYEQHQQFLISAIERITGLKYHHPDLERESVTAFIAEVREQERRPDKRPGAGGPAETAVPPRQSSIPRPAAGEDDIARKKPDQQSWPEVVITGAAAGLLGYAMLRLFTRMRSGDATR